MTDYSNPRLEATIDNWPSGKRRVTASFSIEQVPGKGERAVRVTDGSKPKKLTYARKARIVDGDDGRTYIAELSAFGHVSIMKGTMDYQHEVIHENDPRHPSIMRLFAEPETGFISDEAWSQ